MKKTLSSLFAIILASILFYSCGRTEKNETTALSFDSVQIDTATYFYYNGDTLSATVHLQLLLAKGPGSETINDSIVKNVMAMNELLPQNDQKLTAKQKLRAFVDKFLQDYKKGFDNLKKANCLSPAFQYALNIKSTVQKSSDSTIIHQAEGYVFMGGAHGTSTISIYNINIHTGVILTKENVFKTGSEQAVAKLIMQGLMKQFHAKNLSDLQNKGIFTFNNPYIPNNFIIKPDSITFIYQQDEMSPHAMGVIQCTISKNNLNKFLK